MHSLWERQLTCVSRTQTFIPVNLIIKFLKLCVEVWYSFWVEVTIPLNCLWSLVLKALCPKFVMAQNKPQQLPNLVESQDRGSLFKSLRNHNKEPNNSFLNQGFQDVFIDQGTLFPIYCLLISQGTNLGIANIHCEFF